MSKSVPRYGVWAPYGGGFLSEAGKPPLPAPFSLTRDYILQAEKLGFSTVLLAQHTLGVNEPEQEILEAWTASAALAAITHKIEIIAAIKPKLYHPVVLAKMALGIEDISDGRFALNFVNAWFKPELERAGIPFGEHDDRYIYGGEWLGIVKRLMSGETVTHHGTEFKVTDYTLRPISRHRARPRLYSGGESEPARNLAVQLADFWFINGQPPEEVKLLIEDVSKRPREGAPIQFGMSAFIIARETEAEAKAVLEKYQAINAAHDRTEFFKNIDPKAVTSQKYKKYMPVGTNGGTAAGLVGDYDTVARRMLEFHALGVEVFMLQFHPLFEEMERFAREIIPRVQVLADAN